MAESPEIIKNTETLTVSQRIQEFIQKNRKTLFISLIALVVILAGLIIFVTVRERTQANAISKVDGFNRRYEEIRLHIGSGEPSAIIHQVEAMALLLELGEFQNRASGFAAAWAYSISANIFTEQGQWGQAEEAWSNAAKAAGKSYFAPISFFNAAVAAEEQGRVEAAIDYYNRALGYGDIFHSEARAQFSIARLEEERNNKDAALAAYRNLMSKWPDDPVWANLAQNRILVLSE